MEQQESAWITAIGTAIGLTGAAATAAGAAIVGAGAGLIGSNIQNLVQGDFPWEKPGEFMLDGLKGAGIGAAGGAITGGLGAGLGEMLNAAGSSLGSAGGGTIGAGTGSIPAQAGAQLPQNITPAVSTATQNIGTAAKNAAGGSLREALGKVATNTVSSGVSGAIKDYENPLRGLAMGAAGGAASSAFSAGMGAAFRGQSAGIIPDTEPYWPQGGDYVTGNAAAPLYDPGREAFAAARTQIMAPRPTLAQNLGMGAQKLGSNFAGKAAGSMVGDAMTPDPSMPQDPNPYAQYGVQPYWARRM